MIKVCFLLSYDYAFVKYSLPCVYPYADSITFSIDRNRTSWSGNQYKFDESIIDWIKAYDTEQKIRIYEDDFYVPGKTAMENDTRQRNKTAEFMGKGGWHLQIESILKHSTMFLSSEYVSLLRLTIEDSSKPSLALKQITSTASSIDTSSTLNVLNLLM